MSEIIGQEVLSTQRRTQVFEATHDGEGNRLPLMERSFISFTYGGKNIEDYGFISIIEGGSISRNLYGSFNDITSNYEVMDGQIHWGTYFENNTLSLRMATDALTERRLMELKILFRPGEAKELILAENPNRGIMARVQDTPQYELLPFEDSVEVKVGSQTYKTKTTLYKGFITVNFVMDDPFWYSINNIYTDDTLTNDQLKVIAEDGIPHKSMLASELQCVMGDGVYQKTTGKVTNSAPLNPNEVMPLYYAGNAPAQTIMKFSLQPILDSDLTFNTVQVRNTAIAGDGETEADILACDTAIAGGTVSGEDVPANQVVDTSGMSSALRAKYEKLYRAAASSQGSTTAVSSSFYIQYPNNEIYLEQAGSNGDRHKYNYIQIGNSVFKFTTPSIWTGYNQAIQIFSQFKAGDSLIEVRAALRDGIKEYYSRAWAIGVLNYMAKCGFANTTSKTLQNEPTNGTDLHYAFNQMMMYFITPTPSGSSSDINPWTAYVEFNSKTGEAIGTFKARKIKQNVSYSGNPDTIPSIGQNDNTVSYTPFAELISAQNNVVMEIKENIGDMVYDKYLILQDKNTITNGMITANDCTEVTTDYPKQLGSFEIQYKHMFL